MFCDCESNEDKQGYDKHPEFGNVCGYRFQTCAEQRMFRRGAAEYLLGHVKVHAGLELVDSRLRQGIPNFIGPLVVARLNDSGKNGRIGVCAAVPAYLSRMTCFSILHPSVVPTSEGRECGRQSVRINIQHYH